jgi:hypothetical protein
MSLLLFYLHCLDLNLLLLQCWSDLNLAVMRFIETWSNSLTWDVICHH